MVVERNDRESAHGWHLLLQKVERRTTIDVQ